MKIATVTEVEGEGLESLMGEPVLLMCMNYNYAGILRGVNDSCVKLDDASIVYETGAWTAGTWKDAQKLGHPIYVQTDKIEAFFKGK